MEDKTGTPNPTSGKDEIDLKQKAYMHLAQGKRHLLVKDYYEAANSLAEACTFFDKLYGTGANECGEVYFNYGKALLELGRSESNVLGLGENPDGKEDESDNSDEDANENGEDEPDNDEDSNDEKEDDESSAKGDAEPSEPKADVSEAPEGEPEQEEESEDNLKLAWEVLELAKAIFERQAKSDKQFELKLAEVYFKLCEVGLEAGVYDQAIEDMKVCVEIQKRNLRDDDRLLAESFYELGMAYSLKNDYDVAIPEFQNAIQVLERRVGNLQEMLKQGIPPEVKDSDPFYSIEGEIKELNELIPEIRDKISDMQVAKKETVDYIRDQLMKEQTSTVGEAASSSWSAPLQSSAATEAKPATDVKPAAVMDISHLVRKKRKLDSEVGDEKCQKQACTEPTVADKAPE